MIGAGGTVVYAANIHVTTVSRWGDAHHANEVKKGGHEDGPSMATFGS